MTIPFNNQVFLGGQFNDVLNMGNIELSSIESNNVYVAYLKDDTWLSASSVDHEQTIVYPNPFSQSIRIQKDEMIENLEIYNSSGFLIEKYTKNKIPILLGNNWKPGVYILKTVDSKGGYSLTKVVKNH